MLGCTASHTVPVSIFLSPTRRRFQDGYALILKTGAIDFAGSGVVHMTGEAAPVLQDRAGDEVEVGWNRTVHGTRACFSDVDFDYRHSRMLNQRCVAYMFM